MTGPAISVLTPTYNRAHVLHRAYDSLQRQTVRNFEWVVVDDGSTDATSALLARWQAEADFPITWYRYRNNRGQIPATNTGRRLVSGEYTLKLDSDDALLDNAIETVNLWRQTTEVDKISEVGGLAFRCVDEFGKIVGKLRNGDNSLPKDYLRLSTRNARYMLGIDFDYLIVHKTSVFRESYFEELDGCENVPPHIYVNRISDNHDLVYIDYSIRIYYRHDGTARLSDKHPKSLKWPRGRYWRALAILNEDIGYLRHNPKVFINAARKVIRLGLHIGRSPGSQYRDLAHAHARLLWAIGAPGGLVGYIRDRLRGRTAPKANPDMSAWGPAATPENPELHLPPERFRPTMTTAVTSAEPSLSESSRSVTTVVFGT